MALALALTTAPAAAPLPRSLRSRYLARIGEALAGAQVLAMASFIVSRMAWCASCWSSRGRNRYPSRKRKPCAASAQCHERARITRQDAQDVLTVLLGCTIAVAGVWVLAYVAHMLGF
jgi:hypothetical protein